MSRNMNSTRFTKSSFPGIKIQHQARTVNIGEHFPIFKAMHLAEPCGLLISGATAISGPRLWQLCLRTCDWRLIGQWSRRSSRSQHFPCHFSTAFKQHWIIFNHHLIIIQTAKLHPFHHLFIEKILSDSTFENLLGHPTTATGPVDPLQAPGRAAQAAAFGRASAPGNWS